MKCHNLIARGSKFGVVESLFGRYSPIAWLEMISTLTLRRACVPADCGCTFFAIAKRCRSYPRKRD